MQGVEDRRRYLVLTEEENGRREVLEIMLEIAVPVLGEIRLHIVIFSCLNVYRGCIPRDKYKLGSLWFHVEEGAIAILSATSNCSPI